MSKPLSLRQKLIGTTAFTSVYLLSTITLERKYKRKSPGDHLIGSTVAGFACAVGTGNPVAGMVIGIGLGAVSAPLYWYAYTVKNLPTLSEMLEKTEVTKEEAKPAASNSSSMWPATPAKPADAATTAAAASEQKPEQPPQQVK
jgi:uncharacterized ion transporter superfamily protein YfcC